MTPTPKKTMVSEKTVPRSLQRPMSGEEVVISGLSGIFPSSNSVQEFMENLYNKVNMVTSENPRWVFNHPEVPKHIGKVNGINKFDAQFFRVNYKQACTMEPMSRKLLEHAYSAIYDSGVNPIQLRGKKVGVFIGSAFSESDKVLLYENLQRSGFGISGCNRAMYANRISYWMDSKGPSYCLDLTCASSMACLEHAFRSISSGQCEAAIVGGCNLCMQPNIALHCTRAGFLCYDGKTKCFDKNGEGHVRSDAISVLFLQKAKDAKRIYSEVYHAKASFSPAFEPALPVRDPKELQQFLEAFYSEIDVSPNDVEYIEANGSAIPKADTNEIKVIGKVFAKKAPIKIGCVKSNMGSSESASGVCGVTKVCLAYHSGILPGNLHYSEPLDLPEVRENKVQVLTDNINFCRGFAALNSFSYSGSNVHVLLKGHYKQKNTERYKSSIPHLVLVSGRQENCVRKILTQLKQNSVDPEQIGLLHGIHEINIPGHLSRGYSILGSNAKKETVCLSESVEYFPEKTRPVWFVYSGMGSQWATMGAELMLIPIFAYAIQKCHKVLKPKGVDIVRILTDSDKTIYDNILHSFVGIAAVQIGLTDILKEMGIVPDNIIGHSVGELGCAYADGCLTAEEMILSAYSRGLVSVQTPFIRGAMAAVGLGYKAVLPLCPPEIEVACHNSPESSTISGPAEIMKKFVSELTSQGIFAKEVPCSNIAYHSRYIAEAGPGLLKYLGEVIKNPKARSKKWVSTSIPQDKWDEPLAKYSSAEYHTNNLLNSVLFEETSKIIPLDALVIEIAPHGLLQAILKRSMTNCVHVPLTQRGSTDPVIFLLQAIGKLYQTGLNPKISVLYPQIEFPVSTGTPLLSHYVEWEHSENWVEAVHIKRDRVVSNIRDFLMYVYDDDYKYFKGHVRNGYCIFPESAFLVLVWETIAMYKGVNYKDMSVVFKDVQFYGEVIIKPELPVRLQIMILKGKNNFEVTYEDSAIVSGYIYESKHNVKSHGNLQHEEGNSDNLVLKSKDIYTIMRLRGYGYKGDFQSIHSTTSKCNKANIKWTDNWITHLDSLLQFNAFAKKFDGVSTPLHIKQLKIDVQHHKKANRVTVDNVLCLSADLYKIYDHIRCGGVEIDGLVFKDNPIVEPKLGVLLRQTFIPNDLTEIVSIKTALQITLQVVSENVSKHNVQVIDLVSEKSSEVSKTIVEVAEEILGHEFIIKSIKDDNIQSFENIDLLVMFNLLADEKKMNEVYEILPKNTFILSLEEYSIKIYLQNKLFSVITTINVHNKQIVLLKKVDANTYADKNITYLRIIHDHTSKFSWIPQMRAELEKRRKIVLVSERQPYCGLIGMVKVLRKEYGDKIRLIVVDDYHVPSFNPEQEIFKAQLLKKMAFNVLNKGQWGSYYYIPGEITKLLENLYLSNTMSGDLDALSWIEKLSIPTSSNLVQVYYAGVSIMDAKIPIGESNTGEKIFGTDFSGINKRGEKVIGIVSGGTIESTVEADPDFLWTVPEHWTLEDAATVPLAYAHAYYCLSIKTKLRRGSVVLINGGAGAFGQASIAVCLSQDCKVYVTVADIDQKEFLLKIFPDLEEQNIGCIPQLVLQEMGTDVNNNITVKDSLPVKRCDIVINYLSGPMRRAAMKCIGFRGIFLDVNVYDMVNNEHFGMSFLWGATTYMGVRLNTVFKPKYYNDKKLIQLRITEGIANGIVRPLSRVVYSPADVTRAFRLLSSNKQRSKVLIKMKSSKSMDQLMSVTTRMAYSPNGSYIVICDRTALSIELADRLVKHGARNLVLQMKPNSIAGYCYSKFISWKKHNVSLQILSESLQTEKGCVNLFKESAKLGPVRGIFIVHSFNSGPESWAPEDIGIKFNNTISVVANLDLLSRNVCNELDHFVILNYSSQSVSDEYVSSVTDKICQSRNEIGLPALVFRASQVFELDDNETAQSKFQPQHLGTMFNALETSLKFKHNNVISYNLKKNVASEFNEKISRIIGVKDIFELDENLTLKDLLLNEVSIEEINTTIRNTYQVSYSLEKLKRITIANLKNLGNKQSKTVSSKGLGAFFTYIDHDEYAAAEPIVPMVTSFSNVKEEEELDPKATYLMLVPGFEGHHQIFTTFSEMLKVQALTFQLVPDMTNESVAQIAANIAKFVRKRLELKSKFYILGYSFGVNVALELAKLFENEGHVGVVYCLDSSPDALRAQLDAYIGILTDSRLQNTIIEHMYKLMSGQDSVELKQELETKENWSDKVELCVNKLRGKVKYSHQYIRCLLDSAYRRIILARDYEPDFTLESELVLIKSIPHSNMRKLADVFNLSKYTNKPVQVFDIESDHTSAHQDCRVSNIVNRLLEPKLLEEFRNKNLCWTYLAEANKTW